MPSLPQIDETLLTEASEWFACLQDAHEDPAVREEFSSWLLRSPNHIAAFLQITRTWGDVGLISAEFPAKEELVRLARESIGEQPSNVVPLHPRRGIADAQLTAPIDEPEPRQKPEPAPPPRTANRWLKYSIAASMVFAVLALGWLALDRWVLNPTYIRTAIGEQRSVVLPDGSIVQLNTNSELYIEYTPSVRQVRLPQGEARFTVAKDEQRPFIVKTPQATVRALGTVFNVQTAPRGTDVAVLEGRVEIRTQAELLRAPTGVVDRLRAPSVPASTESEDDEDATAAAQGALASASSSTPAPIVLSAGEQAAVTDDGKILPNSGPPIERVRAWTDRRLVFREETLEALVAEVNRYHTHPMRITDPKVATLRISGTFAAQDIDSLIEYLRRYRGVDSEKLPDGSILLKPATSPEESSH